MDTAVIVLAGYPLGRSVPVEDSVGEGISQTVPAFDQISRRSLAWRRVRMGLRRVPVCLGSGRAKCSIAEVQQPDVA